MFDLQRNSDPFGIFFYITVVFLPKMLYNASVALSEQSKKR